MRNLGQYVGGVVVTPPEQLSIIRVRNVTKFEHQEATNLVGFIAKTTHSFIRCRRIMSRAWPRMNPAYVSWQGDFSKRDFHQ